MTYETAYGLVRTLLLINLGVIVVGFLLVLADTDWISAIGKFLVGLGFVVTMVLFAVSPWIYYLP